MLCRCGCFPCGGHCAHVSHIISKTLNPLEKCPITEEYCHPYSIDVIHLELAVEVENYQFGRCLGLE